MCGLGGPAVGRVTLCLRQYARDRSREASPPFRLRSLPRKPLLPGPRFCPESAYGRSMMWFGELGRPSSQRVHDASTAQGSKRTDLPHVLGRADRYAGTIPTQLVRQEVGRTGSPFRPPTYGA